MKIHKTKSGVSVSVQYVTTEKAPKKPFIMQIVEHALANEIDHPHPLHVGVRIVSEAESATLNQTYRQKTGPTNVLAFPFIAFPGFQDLPTQELGDLVICAAVMAREAEQQAKPLEAHFAHLLIHGVLHLLGHDHVTPEEATKMEAREIILLQKLDYPNPYEAL